MASVVRCYGAKPDNPDWRDIRKEYTEIPSWDYYYTQDLQKYVDHVYDQGSIASCTANALCAAYGLDLKKQSQTLDGGYQYFNPSRLFLYYNTRDYELTTFQDSGASIRDTIKALNRKGVCEESSWPYIPSNLTKKPSSSCYKSAEGNTLCKYERLMQDVDQLRACLNSNCPFVFGFNVYASFYNIGSDGVMTMPWYYREKEIGKHAVVAVGYSDRKQQFKVLNSWGPNWGDHGYFYVPYDFIKEDRWCFDFWKITFSCQKGKPRPKDTVTMGYATSGGSSYGKSYGAPRYR